MKGCARSCLTSLLGWMVAIALSFVGLVSFGVDAESAQGSSILIGSLATLSISFLWSARGVRRDQGLIRDALAGVSPIDGKWAGFSGTIRSATPLTSPLSAQRVVAFKYRVHERVGSGKSAYTVVHYEGTSLAAPTISTNLGAFRLLAVPEFNMEATDVEKSVAIRNFETYSATVRFESKATSEERRQRIEAEWTDDDGVFGRDVKGADKVDLFACQFDEGIISQGEQVCLVGLYSQARGGIVPDANWAHQTKVIRGNGEKAIEQLGRRARRYTLFGIILGVVSVGVVFFAMDGASRFMG